MLSHNTPQEYPTAQNRHRLAEASMRRFIQHSAASRHARHWVCTGCGTAHASMFPEECLSCGATALEFAYASPAEHEAAS